MTYLMPIAQTLGQKASERTNRIQEEAAQPERYAAF